MPHCSYADFRFVVEPVMDGISYGINFFSSGVFWKGHAEENAKKGEKRLSLLKRLAGVTWGSSPDVLSTTYKSHVRPVLDYGGEFLATSSKSCCDIIDKIPNKALRLITTAASSSHCCP
ncbi:uncharacterized protein TNCV_2119371 [Trichonephila clavipes]|nr:uncharacterized protein TNCV_2119371 [Trichonephila clavipes]